MNQPSGSLESVFARLHEELRQWRAAHPDATPDEIAAQVAPRRRHLMGALWAELAVQEGNGYAVEGLCCEQCGRPVVYRGTAEREVLLLEADMALVRAYYHCAHCEEGFSPWIDTVCLLLPSVERGQASGKRGLSAPTSKPDLSPAESATESITLWAGATHDGYGIIAMLDAMREVH